MFGSSKMTVDEELLGNFVFYGALLVFKMLIMSPLTARQRHKNGVFANAEDAKMHQGSKVSTTNEDVERVRRAHLNDMEGIYLFFANAVFYMMTKPNVWVATNLLRAFTASRFLHTIFYLNECRQPTRGLSWMIGVLIQFYMVGCTIMHFF